MNDLPWWHKKLVFTDNDFLGEYAKAAGTEEKKKLANKYDISFEDIEKYGRGSRVFNTPESIKKINYDTNSGTIHIEVSPFITEQEFDVLWSQVHDIADIANMGEPLPRKREPDYADLLYAIHKFYRKMKNPDFSLIHSRYMRKELPGYNKPPINRYFDRARLEKYYYDFYPK